MTEMSEQAREAYNAYMREWKKNNRDKVRESKARYWERKAAEQRQKGETNDS